MHSHNNNESLICHSHRKNVNLDRYMFNARVWSSCDNAASLVIFISLILIDIFLCFHPKDGQTKIAEEWRSGQVGWGYITRGALPLFTFFFFSFSIFYALSERFFKNRFAMKIILECNSEDKSSHCTVIITPSLSYRNTEQLINR